MFFDNQGFYDYDDFFDPYMDGAFFAQGRGMMHQQRRFPHRHHRRPHSHCGRSGCCNRSGCCGCRNRRRWW